MYFAEIQSIIGDQLARFALSVLVFDRTGSATAAALTYAVSFLPAIVGGIVLGSLGDRYPQRPVMVCADLIRAGLFVTMAIPGLSVGLIVTILAVAVFVGPAFSSAEVTYLAGALEPEVFRTGTALRSASNQVAQVVGFAVGGVVVLALHPRGALLIDAGTFLLSAGLVTVGLRRPRRAVSAALRQAGDPGPLASSTERFDGLWHDRHTRIFMILTLLTGLFVAPEGLVVPFGHKIGATVAESGVLVSTIALGSAVGAALIVRLPARLRRLVACWMAVGCGLPLLVSAVNPPWQLACLCWFVSGLLASYQVEAITGLVRSIPDGARSRLIGVVGAWLLGAQGAGFALSGLASHGLGPGGAIAAAGGLGSGVALVTAVSVSRMGVPGKDAAGKDEPENHAAKSA